MIEQGEGEDLRGSSLPAGRWWALGPRGNGPPNPRSLPMQAAPLVASDVLCEGVFITQRNNSAVLGFVQPHSNSWGKYLNGRKKKLSNLIFFKFSPSIVGVKFYIVLNFGGHLAPHFWGKGGQISKLAPLYLRKLGLFGVENFFFGQGAEGSTNRNLRVWTFPHP